MLHLLLSVAAAAATASSPIASGYTAIIYQEITDSVTTIIFYLQERAVNKILTNILIRLPYNTAEDLPLLGSGLKHIHALTANPTSILIPDIKSENALLHEIFHMIPLKPSITTQLHQNLTEHPLKYIRADTST